LVRYRRATEGSAARTDADPEVETGAEPAEGERVRPRIPVVVLAAAVVLITAVAGWLAWLDHSATGADRSGRAALAAAVGDAERILSYDHRRIDADIAAASARTTGAFRKDYADTSRTVAPVAKQYQAVVTATVKAASVVSAEPGEAVVLLFVDQATRSTRVQGTKVDHARVRMTMVETDAGWRVAKVEAL
jgi:Mce-associated membrane protein